MDELHEELQAEFRRRMGDAEMLIRPGPPVVGKEQYNRALLSLRIIQMAQKVVVAEA